MEREQVRDALARIAGEAHEAQQGAQRAYDMARRLEKSLAVPFEEPEVEPEPEPDQPTGGILVTVFFHTKAIRIDLPREARASRVGGEAADPWEEMYPFVEHFRTEAGGVVETVCVLHNGNPQGKGAIRIPKLEIKTHDGRDIFDWQGPVTIEPGGMLCTRDYKGNTRATANLSQAELQRRFWHALPYNIKPFPAIDGDLSYLLDVELEKQLANPVTVGPYDVAWGSRGDEVGGAGTEPDWFEWRRCPAGYALAALEMYRVANRTSRCMTDADGAFTWDRDTAYTSVGDFMPDAFKWEPRDETERAMQAYKNHDGQHFFRAYRAAMALARETQHPFALWYLQMLANFQQAAHLGTAGDDATSGWWSLEKKRASVNGPNIFCGRQGVHEARFANEYEALFDEDDEADALAGRYRELFRASLNRHGVPFVMPTSAIVSKDAPQAWGDDPAAQVFEWQLAILMFEDSGDPTLERAAKKLAAYIGPHPPYCKNVKTGQGSGTANPYLNLATHGVGFASEADMWKVTKDRVESGGPEAGGAVPANSFRPRRGIVS